MDYVSKLNLPLLQCTLLTIHSCTYQDLLKIVMAFYIHFYQKNLLFFTGLGIPSPPLLIRYLPSTYPYKYCHLSTSSLHNPAAHLVRNCLRMSCLIPTRKNQLRASYRLSISPHIDYTSTGKIKVSSSICLSHFSFHSRNYQYKCYHSTTYTTQNPQVSPLDTDPHTNPHY